MKKFREIFSIIIGTLMMFGGLAMILEAKILDARILIAVILIIAGLLILLYLLRSAFKEDKKWFF